jgi:hypothetical protein
MEELEFSIGLLHSEVLLGWRGSYGMGSYLSRYNYLIGAARDELRHMWE